MNMPDINALLESLSEEDISSLGSIAQQLFSETATQRSSSDFNPTGGIDPSLLAALMQIMPMLQESGENDRTRLICALKPLLSKNRRKKADEAMQLIRLIDILPLINALNL